MKKVLRHPPLFYLAIGIALLFWLGESILHYYLFDHGHDFELIPRESNEIWMRILICVMIVAFGLFSERMQRRLIASNQEKLELIHETMRTIEDKFGNYLVEAQYVTTSCQASENNQKLLADFKKSTEQVIHDFKSLQQLNSYDIKTSSSGIRYLNPCKNS